MRWFIGADEGTPQDVTRQVPSQRTERKPRQQPWWRSPGTWGDRRTGAPPAASALGLRRALALFGVVFCGVVSGLFAVADHTAPAVALMVIGATALIDLIVIHRRMVTQRRSGSPRP
ncbi:MULTISPECIES: DUF6343 family protein [unclassified Frankia]|uniref:DUF6343 family protein n=1 Tax=unclassified Frankia TaxID=2632575 RepID=UPI000A686207|nr:MULTISPECIES: DUF6343 family protein [unclassified Frankia]